MRQTVRAFLMQERAQKMMEMLRRRRFRRLSPAFSDLLLTCLEGDPTKRMKMADVAARLATIGGALPSFRFPTPPPPTPSPNWQSWTDAPLTANGSSRLPMLARGDRGAVLLTLCSCE